ncbi:MAG: hypothetical protein ACK4PH_18965, partial [Aquincola tertiaricarbonis]
NGLGGLLQWWHKVLPEVARETTVFAYNRAGLGDSEAAPPPRVFDTTVAAEGGSEAALVAAMRTAVARWADAVAQAAGGTAAAAGR